MPRDRLKSNKKHAYKPSRPKFMKKSLFHLLFMILGCQKVRQNLGWCPAGAFRVASFLATSVFARKKVVPGAILAPFWADFGSFLVLFS